MGYDVDHEAYDEALGITVSREIQPIRVDATGHDPQVGFAHGRDYLTGSLLFFSSEQLDENAVRDDNDYMDGMVDVLRHDEAFCHNVDTFGPIGLDVGFSVDPEGYTLTASYSPELSSESFSRAVELKEEIESVESRDLERYDDLDGLVEAVRSGDYGALQQARFADPVAEQRLNGFWQDHGHASSFALTLDEPYVITVGRDRTRWMREQDGHWFREDLSDVLSELYDRGKLRRDLDGIQNRLEELSSEVVEEFEMDYEMEEMDYPAYTKIVWMMDIEERLPDEWSSLTALMNDEDLGLRSDGDWEKLSYLEGTDERSEELLDRLQEAHERGSPVGVHRYREYRNDVADIRQRYERWDRNSMSHYGSAGRHARSMDYSAEMVAEFVQTTELDGEAGVFVTALVNHMEEDEIELPAMKGVERVGDHLRDKHMIVDGKVGRRAGWHMMGGTLEVRGKVGGTFGDVGPFMEGGEIYLHRNGKQSDLARGGTVYKKKGGWLREEEWVEV